MCAVRVFGTGLASFFFFSLLELHRLQTRTKDRRQGQRTEDQGKDRRHRLKRPLTAYRRKDKARHETEDKEPKTCEHNRDLNPGKGTDMRQERDMEREGWQRPTTKSGQGKPARQAGRAQRSCQQRGTLGKPTHAKGQDKAEAVVECCFPQSSCWSQNDCANGNRASVLLIPTPPHPPSQGPKRSSTSTVPATTLDPNQSRAKQETSIRTRDKVKKRST